MNQRHSFVIRHAMTNSSREQQHCCCSNNSCMTHSSTSSGSSALYAYRTDFSIPRRKKYSWRQQKTVTTAYKIQGAIRGLKHRPELAETKETCPLPHSISCIRRPRLAVVYNICVFNHGRHATNHCYSRLGLAYGRGRG